MKLYPTSALDFQDMFPTEKACTEYLNMVRWPEGFVCPNCKHVESWELGSGLLRCRGCRRDISVTAGTIFQDSHLPLRLWFLALWYVVCQKQGVSALALKGILGLGSYKTAWTCLHKLRRAMVRPGRDRLSGVVEVDEILIGGLHKGAKGRGTFKKAVVLVAVEDKEGQNIGRIRLAHIANASHASIVEALKEMIEPGSVVRTDKWQGYAGLTRDGYDHVTIGKETAPDQENLTPLVHRIASLLKRWLLNTHQGGVQHSHLAYYLDEFVFRFNRRSSRSRGLLFYRLVQNGLAAPPSPASRLVA